MLYTILLSPVKQYLEVVSRRGPNGMPPARDIGLMSALAIIVMVLVLIHFAFRYAIAPFMDHALSNDLISFSRSTGDGGKFWGLPEHHDSSTLVFFQEILSYVEASTGSLMILIIFPMVSNHTTYTNWLVLVNTYIFR